MREISDIPLTHNLIGAVPVGQYDSQSVNEDEAKRKCIYRLPNRKLVERIIVVSSRFTLHGWGDVYAF